MAVALKPNLCAAADKHLAWQLQNSHRRRAVVGSGRARKRRRRVVESESDSDGGSDDDERARQLGGAVPATLTAGRLTRGAGASGAGDSAGFSFSSGSGGERHQAAVAEARRHLGGGGKRGWLA